MPPRSFCSVTALSLWKKVCRFLVRFSLWIFLTETLLVFQYSKVNLTFRLKAVHWIQHERSQCGVLAFHINPCMSLFAGLKVVQCSQLGKDDEDDSYLKS